MVGPHDGPDLLRTDEARRLEEAEAHIHRQIRSRNEWTQAGLATSELACLRLAVVLAATNEPAFRGAPPAPRP